MTILAIDQGTTTTRGLRLQRNGKAAIVKVLEHRQIYPHAGWVEHDPLELLGNIQACIDACDDITAIGIDNQGESCLAWDADSGMPISPVIVWQDNRTSEVVERLKKDNLEALVLEKSALPLDPYFSASKLGWIMENIPQARTLAARGKLRLGTTDAFFLDRLTGQYVTDITTASRTSLLNLNSGQWDTELCEIFNVPIEALPRIVSTTGEFGSIGDRQIPVCASVVDQQASLYGHGCRASGDAKITFGTGAFALVVTGNKPFRAPSQGLLPTCAWQHQGEAPVYALDGGVYCAGSAINWARGLGLFNEYTELNQFDRPSAISRSLAFVPALTGLACPHWDRRASGMWIGMSLDTDRRDLLQALLEGIAFRAAEVVAAMSSFSPIGKQISIDGGLTVNPYFCQFLANVLQRNVVVQEFAELTALGTAMLAAQQQFTVPALKSASTIYQPADTAERVHEQTERFGEAVKRARHWYVPI